MAIKHQQPDLVPLFIRYVGAVSSKLSRIHGIAGRDLEIKLGNDGVIVQIGINAEYSHKVVPDGERWTSEWGVTYEGMRGISQPVDHPLKEPDVSGYIWPDPHKPERMAEIKQAMARYHSDYAVMVDLSCTFLEAGYAHLRGMEKFMMDLHLSRDFACQVLDGLNTYYTALGVHAIEQGIDIIRIGDDIAGQNGMLVPPKLWRELVKPRMESMIHAFRKANPNIIVKYHSCGDFSAIIPDLIDLGVDFIGTMQPCGQQVDMAAIKAKYGDKLAFLGGLDTQQLLPNGSPEEVREAVKDVLRSYAPGGGYVFMPGHYVNLDVPLENVWALLSAVHDYRRYPLNFD